MDSNTDFSISSHLLLPSISSVCDAFVGTNDPKHPNLLNNGNMGELNSVNYSNDVRSLGGLCTNGDLLNISSSISSFIDNGFDSSGFGLANLLTTTTSSKIDSKALTQLHSNHPHLSLPFETGSSNILTASSHTTSITTSTNSISNTSPLIRVSRTSSTSNGRKSKRVVTSSRKPRSVVSTHTVVGSNTSTNPISMLCDSSTDRMTSDDQFMMNISSESCNYNDRSNSAIFMKRSRLFMSGLPNLVKHHENSCPILNVSQQQQYLSGDQSQCFMIKSEPNQQDELDDMSTHSGSISVGTGHALVDNTPVSSLDEVEQNHLKLERKRARNRVAARRCRERKISLIRTLENQVAERDAHVKNLESTLARYRVESERLRLHMEMLASSYPSLKAELYQFPFLFQSQGQSGPIQPKLSSNNGVDMNTSHLTHSNTPSKADLADMASAKHYV